MPSESVYVGNVCNVCSIFFCGFIITLFPSLNFGDLQGGKFLQSGVEWSGVEWRVLCCVVLDRD